MTPPQPGDLDALDDLWPVDSIKIRMKAALAGAATGSRSLTGLAAVALTARSEATAQPERVLAQPLVKGLIALGAAVEWVLDQLPQAPSRLEPAGFGARVVCAAACGALLARRAALTATPPRPAEPGRGGFAGGPASRATGEPGRPEFAGGPAAGTAGDAAAGAVVGAVVAAAAAGGTAWLGVRFRGVCTSAFGRDWPGAALEDAVSAALAVASVSAAS